MKRRLPINLMMIGVLAVPLSAGVQGMMGVTQHAQHSCAVALSGSSDNILLTVDALPSGETIRPLLGVNAGPLPGALNPSGADLTAQYRDIGVSLIRTHDYNGPLDMSVMYPDQNADPLDPASYDFEASDHAFQAILDGGFEPVLRLGDSYSVEGLEQRAPTNSDNWIRAAVEVVRRYRRMAAEAGIPLRYVEIWNEPDNPHFWDGTSQAFFDLFTRTVPALKAEFPDLKVGGPGLITAGALAPQGQQYTQNLLAHLQEHSVPLDFFSWHVYSNDPEDYRQAARFYRQQLDAHGYALAESHITEWNVEKGTEPVAPTEVAALLSTFWIALQEEDVAASMVYRGADQGMQQGDADLVWGLLYADGRFKPHALAFSLWAQTAAHPQRLNVTQEGEDGLWVLSGQDEQGEVAVFLVNPTARSTSWQAVFPGRDLAQDATLYQVGGSGEEVQTLTLETPAAEIGPYSVQLLLVQPAQGAETVFIPIGGVDPTDPQTMPLLGVISGPDPTVGFTEPNLTTQYQDIGVVSVRNNDYFDDRLDMEGIFNCGGPTYPSWEGCDANDDAFYNWGPSDVQFASYLNGGFDPFLRLGGEWANRDREHDFKGPQNAAQEANWIIAAHKVVQRYSHWDGAEQTFTYLDIWTEFPGGHFWDRSNIEFINFWVRAYASLKGAYPQLKVGGPGFVAGETMKVIQGDAELSRALLAELYHQGLHLDWFGWHFFGNDPTQWALAALAYRQLLDGAGPYADVPWAGTGFFADTEIIVDAYGLSSNDTDGALATPDKRMQLYTGSRSASLLTATWIAMQYGDVERAYYYRGNDFGASSPGDGSEGPGLFYGDAAGTYKPAAHAFRIWSQVVNGFPMLLTTPLPPTAGMEGLWLLAARNEWGKIALLVANTAAEEVTWAPTFEDGRTLADSQVTLYQVDDVRDGRTPLPWTGGAITTPGESVQLLVLSPKYLRRMEYWR